MRLILLSLMISFSFPAWCWDGYDWEQGSSVEIEKGNLVRKGRDIEIYDYDSGEYRNVEVQNIKRRGNNVDVEVYDYESGEYRELEMDGD